MNQKLIAIGLIIALPAIITIWANIPGLLPHTKKFINGAIGPVYMFCSFIWYYADTRGRGKLPSTGWIVGFAFIFPIPFVWYLIRTRNLREIVKVIICALVILFISSSLMVMAEGQMAVPK